jgi:hypothetical protein
LHFSLAQTYYNARKFKMGERKMKKFWQKLGEESGFKCSFDENQAVFQRAWAVFDATVSVNMESYKTAIEFKKGSEKLSFEKKLNAKSIENLFTEIIPEMALPLAVLGFRRAKRVLKK